MKYIAVFDIPDDYAIGCAVVKMAKRGKEVYTNDDFTDVYANVEPLVNEKAEVFERFNTVERVLRDVGMSCIYDMPSFWSHDREKYHVIATKYHKGYMKALDDIEKEIRRRFGFAEKEDMILSPYTAVFMEEKQ